MYPNKKKLWQILFPRLSLFTYPWLSWNKEVAMKQRQKENKERSDQTGPSSTSLHSPFGYDNAKTAVAGRGGVDREPLSSFQKRATREPLEPVERRWRKWRGGNEGRSNLEEIAIIRLPTTETWGASPPTMRGWKRKKKKKGGKRKKKGDKEYQSHEQTKLFLLHCSTPATHLRIARFSRGIDPRLFCSRLS